MAAWALIREPAAVRVAADPENEAALFDVREGHLARWAEVNERLWAESGWSKPDDLRDWRIDVLADVDPADLPPPFDELRARRMRQLEAEGKIRLTKRAATFPIEDYLASLFRAGRINAIVDPLGGAAAHASSSADWAFLEIAGGDHRRLFVRRIGERGPAFSDVRVERAQVLAVLPPLEGAPVLPVFPLKEAPAPTRAQQTESGRLRRSEDERAQRRSENRPCEPRRPKRSDVSTRPEGRRINAMNCCGC